MLKDKATMLIFSCDKFSDLWQGHIKLLEENWPDRGMKTYIVTDSNKNGYQFENVEILAVGDNVEWSDRLAAALDRVRTDYVLFTLDDYYPIHPIQTERIERLIQIADTENLDYIRLFHMPWGHQRFKDYKDLYEIDLYASQYAVNLYAGIWRTDFMKQTAKAGLTAWAFEVSLTKAARELNAKCIMSKGKEFEILDVIRKGKLLNHANWYFKRHPGIYTSDRQIIKLSTEVYLNSRMLLKELLPRKVLKWLKAQGRKHGMQFYSE